MTENQKQSTKKWIDYSDDSEQQNNSDREENQHTNHYVNGKQQNTNNISNNNDQQAQIKILEGCFNKAWLYIHHTENDRLVQLIQSLKKEKQHYLVYEARGSEKGWDVRLSIEKAKDVYLNGLQQDKKLKIEVSKKNIKKQRYDREGEDNRGNRRQRGQRGGYNRRGRQQGRGDRRGDRRGGRGGRDDRNNDNRQEKKKVYVDKETGQGPDNKKNLQKRKFQENERKHKYTKQQAIQRGNELGQFRKIPLANRISANDQGKQQIKEHTEFKQKKQSKEFKQKKQYKNNLQDKIQFSQRKHKQIQKDFRDEKNQKQVWARKDTEKVQIPKKTSYKLKQDNSQVTQLPLVSNQSKKSRKYQVKKIYEEKKEEKKQQKVQEKKEKNQQQKQQDNQQKKPIQKKNQKNKKKLTDSNNRFSSLLQEDSN